MGTLISYRKTGCQSSTNVSPFSPVPSRNGTVIPEVSFPCSARVWLWVTFPLPDPEQGLARLSCPTSCLFQFPCPWQTSLINPMWQTSLINPMLPAATPTFGLGCHLNARLYTATPSQLELAWRTSVRHLLSRSFFLETPHATATRRAGPGGVWEGPDRGTHALVSSSSTPVTGIP